MAEEVVVPVRKDQDEVVVVVPVGERLVLPASQGEAASAIQAARKALR